MSVEVSERVRNGNYSGRLVYVASLDSHFHVELTAYWKLRHRCNMRRLRKMADRLNEGKGL